jgi:S1-C subfamily serine protease
VKAQFKFLSGARAGEVEAFVKGYIGVGRHPLSDVRFDAERDLDVSSRHASITRGAAGFVLKDLDSRNGTFVNGARVTGDVVLKDGDVIGFGEKGPALEFHTLDEGDVAAESGAAGLARRASAPRQEFAAAGRATLPPPTPAPRRSSTGVRIAQEVARQTSQLRRTTKLLFGALVLAFALFGFFQWQGGRERARDQREIAQFQNQVEALRDALAQSHQEVSRIQSQLDTAARKGDDTTLVRLRAELAAAEHRYRSIVGAAAVDYRSISQRNQDAVALVLVEFGPGEVFSGTAFSVDSQGTLVTNKHVLVGEDGTRQPQRIAVKFSGSKQWFPGRMLGVSSTQDLGVLKVDIPGGVPRVAGVSHDARAVQRGDPVAIIGFPLGIDLPMEGGQGVNAVADPTLTAGTVSKVLTTLVQVDGYGAPGSSGSPIFDRDGHVVAVLYGGERESNGKIIYSVPAYFVVDYLRSLNLLK